jgi:hypothetical protein
VAKFVIPARGVWYLYERKGLDFSGIWEATTPRTFGWLVFVEARRQFGSGTAGVTHTNARVGIGHRGGIWR